MSLGFNSIISFSFNRPDKEMNSDISNNVDDQDTNILKAMVTWVLTNSRGQCMVRLIFRSTDTPSNSRSLDRQSLHAFLLSSAATAAASLLKISVTNSDTSSNLNDYFLKGFVLFCFNLKWIYLSIVFSFVCPVDDFSPTNTTTNICTVWKVIES